MSYDNVVPFKQPKVSKYRVIITSPSSKAEEIAREIESIHLVHPNIVKLKNNFSRLDYRSVCGSMRANQILDYAYHLGAINGITLPANTIVEFQNFIYHVLDE